MMKLKLSNSNLTGIIAFVKFKSESFYCIADVEYWLADSWCFYADDQANLEEGYFNFIKENFKANYKEMCTSFPDVYASGDDFDITASKPLLYIDFDEKTFVSYYYEQDLEENVLEGWIGKYNEVYDLIPEGFRYWDIKF